MTGFVYCDALPSIAGSVQNTACARQPVRNIRKAGKITGLNYVWRGHDIEKGTGEQPLTDDQKKRKV